MPDDKNEIIDDIITDMNIETITLDDVELNDLSDISPQEKTTGQVKSEGISSSMDEISFEKLETQPEDQSEVIPLPNLDSIQNITEPEIPVVPAFMEDEAPEEKEESGASNNAGRHASINEPISSEDDIISIEGSELDKLIYSGFKADEGKSVQKDLSEIPIIEESKVEEEINFIQEEPEKEENFIPPIDLRIEENTPAKEESSGMDFNFDLSAIPDVSEIEEDEPIALSLDELNKIDISEETVLDYETPSAPEVPEVKTENNIPVMEEENVEISFDDMNRIEESLPEAGKISQGAYEFNNIDNKEITEEVIENKIDILSDSSKDELRKVLGYLDNLLESLPEEKIKEFAKSEYYDLYVKILSKLGI